MKNRIWDNEALSFGCQSGYFYFNTVWPTKNRMLTRHWPPEIVETPNLGVSHKILRLHGGAAQMVIGHWPPEIVPTKIVC